MGDTQWRRVDEIESYKQKTFNLSRTDRIGHLITKTFDLMQTIIRDGPNAETLIYDVESLKTEQANAMKWDANQSDVFRSILYDLSSSLGSMVESIQERNITENSNETFQGTFNDNTAEFTGENSSTYQSFMSDTIKLEPVEFQEDRVFTNFDLNPYVTNDSCSRNPEEGIIVNSTEVILDNSEAVNVDANSERNGKSEGNTGTAQESPEIRESSRMRPRSVIAPKTIYEEEEEGEDVDEEPVSPATPGAGNFNCDRCERSFNNSSALKRHKIFHKGTRCGDCGKRLKTRNNLQRHYAGFHPGKRAKTAKVHRSLKCAQCGYIAAQHSNLVNHMRTHTGERPFSCHKCTLKFTENGALYRHLRRVHNDKPHKCEDCGMKFDRQAEMVQHKKVKHGN